MVGDIKKQALVEQEQSSLRIVVSKLKRMSVMPFEEYFDTDVFTGKSNLLDHAVQHRALYGEVSILEGRPYDSFNLFTTQLVRITLR